MCLELAQAGWRLCQGHRAKPSCCCETENHQSHVGSFQVSGVSSWVISALLCLKWKAVAVIFFFFNVHGNVFCSKDWKSLPLAYQNFVWRAVVRRDALVAPVPSSYFSHEELKSGRVRYRFGTRWLLTEYIFVCGGRAEIWDHSPIRKRAGRAIEMAQW